ncbi:MAG: sigma 54-interacting transcriptional regulator [bacterium]
MDEFKRTTPKLCLEDLSPERFEIVINSIADGVFTVDRDFRINCFNRSASEITGVPREEAIGRHCYEVLKANICQTACALRFTMETGTPLVDLAITIQSANEGTIPVSISSSLMRDDEGNVIGGVETFRDLSLVEELRKELKKEHSFQDIISKSPNMKKIFDVLPTIARSESTVLIQGESGTGKELMARALHNLSLRRDKPLIAVNCSALPDTLLESELFGYEKGAFTGADKAKAGRFALADQGSLFLDEIGDISVSMQAKILRVLEEKTYEPLGSTKSSHADARFIVATNHDLEKLTREGKFREDLYYRINVIKIDLPPLRERKEDIPLLAEQFIKKNNRISGKEITGISGEAMNILMNYQYPGNIRELENIMEHACVLCPVGNITSDYLPAYLLTLAVSAKEKDGSSMPQETTIENMEVRLIKKALEDNNGNRARAARQLGIHKTTLYRKMKKLMIADSS